MEKQYSSTTTTTTLAHYAKKVVQPSIGLFGILREAFKTSIRNGKLLLFITFIMLSHHTVMGLANKFILVPILDDFAALSKSLTKNGSFVDSDADPVLYKAFLKDLRRFLTYEFVSLSFSYLVLVFSIAASVHSTYEAYTAKVLGLKDMLLGLRGRLKRAFSTSIWMIVISLASAALVFFAVGVIGIMAEGSVLSALYWAVVVLGGFYAVYVSALWMLGLVVSVIEEGSSGTKAIAEANELMKGKKLKGIVLMVVMILAGVAISTAFGFLAKVPTASTQNAKMAAVVGVAIGVPENLAYCVLKLFVVVVYTLFYHECKLKKMAEENRALYSPIAGVAEF